MTFHKPQTHNTQQTTVQVCDCSRKDSEALQNQRLKDFKLREQACKQAYQIPGLRTPEFPWQQELSSKQLQLDWETAS